MTPKCEKYLAKCGKLEMKYRKWIQDTKERIKEVKERLTIECDVDVFDYPYQQRIYVDKETGVQYIYISAGNLCGLSVRLDANGKPMVDRSVK